MDNQKKEIKTDEKKQAAASYIITFYNQVILLNDTYSKYLNILVELESKYPGADFEKLSADQEKNALLEMTRTLRYVATNTYIQRKIITESLAKSKNEREDKDVEENYKLIRDKLVPNRDKVEEYTINMNKFLVTNIIQELLTNSSEFLDKIY